jgi:two-component system nitrogen regulation sensor histidine kinase NtrY
MADRKETELPSGERRKRRREIQIIIVSLFFIIALTWAEIQLAHLRAPVELGYKIIIFGLINIVILLIVLLVYLVFRNLAKLFLERRQNVVGARLRSKLVLAFVGLSLVPTMLLFLISAAFVNISINNWFNKQVEASLKEALEVARSYYDSSTANAISYARRIASLVRDQRLIASGDLTALDLLIKQKQTDNNLAAVAVYTSARRELVLSTDSQVPIAEFGKPKPEEINNAFQGKEIIRVISSGKSDLIRAIVPIYSHMDPSAVIGAVAVSHYVPFNLASKMKEISSSYNEYRRLKILKNPIANAYILTLFLITLVIVFLAVGIGVFLSKSLTIPIQELVEATRQVADGNLDVNLGEKGNDEIGMLVASFNKMTQDLRHHQLVLNSTNEELKKSNMELDERRLYIETVLKNVTAGVISVDKHGILTMVNKSAERLMNIKGSEVLGKHFREVLRPDQLDIVNSILRDMVVGKQNTISKQVSIPSHDAKLTLQVNLAILKDEKDEFMGTVVVFDDLTNLIKAQRMAAWREVARRIAHEIKNPLTPIKLSAQRLRKRFLSRLNGEEKVFDECTDMIIKSVEELKTLVDEFSNFARMPAIQPSMNSLNEIISEALTMYQEAHRKTNFTFRPDNSLPQFLLDRDQIKRVLINLLDNAVAAVDGAGDVEIESSYDRDLKTATFVVADNGVGIATEDRGRLFEPYFSTKKSGTGLGLAIVSSIISDHNGYIRFKDNAPKGTRFIVELPVSQA